MSAPRILNESTGCRVSSFSQIARRRRRRGERAASARRRPRSSRGRRRISSSGIRTRPRRRRPRPRRGASTCSAAARSSTASPSDLKTVSSSSERRPSARADQQLADLAADVLGADRALARARRGSRPPRSRSTRAGRRRAPRRAIVSLSSSRVVGMLEPTAFTCAPVGEPVALRRSARATCVAVTTTSAPRPPPRRSRPPRRRPARRAAAPACGSRRGRARTASTARIASRCERAWTPGAEDRERARRPRRASSRVATAGDGGGADRGDRARR